MSYYRFNWTSSLICTTKSDGDRSEIQTANAIQPKFLPYTMNCVQLQVQPNLAPTHVCCNYALVDGAPEAIRYIVIMCVCPFVCLSVCLSSSYVKAEK